MKAIYCIFVLYILLFFSCLDHNTKDRIALKVIIPQHVEIYNPFIADTIIQNLNNYKQRKIYTLINVSCATCLFKLQKWDSLQLEHPNIAIIPVCHSRDNFEQLKFLFENNKIARIHIPLLLDLEDSFAIKNNSLMKSNNLTVLTDGGDRVLLNGDPLESEIDRKKFFGLLKLSK